MTDRELLERAAKAAGLQLTGWTDGDRLAVTEGEGFWNPLRRDGDALRLAVKLGMTVNIENDITAVAAMAGMVEGQFHPQFAAGTEPFDGDPYAATRRAIVRAAAAIGESMP